MGTAAVADLLDPVASIATDAGAAILEIYHRSDHQVETKTDNSPLTAADLASHRLIVDRLNALTPDWPILSEEAASIDPTERRGWQRYWLVDPLDGTKEFIKRNGQFTVNIALIHQHRPILGVVFVPEQSCCYFAAEQRGAWRQRGTDSAKPIRIRRPIDAPVKLVGSRSHATPEQRRFAEACGEHELLAVGSSLKFCLVAAGEADAYPRFGPTSEWDTAAAQCVVEQAGGRVVIIDQPARSLAYNTKDSLLNPYFLVYGDPDYPWHSRLASAQG